MALIGHFILLPGIDSFAACYDFSVLPGLAFFAACDDFVVGQVVNLRRIVNPPAADAWQSPCASWLSNRGLPLYGFDHPGLTTPVSQPALSGLAQRAVAPYSSHAD